jgi:4-amino-4-deoxy-L-arabinose transferase-like glycosyltransferase
MLRKNKELILLLIILAIAVFFRFWQLNLIPPGLYPDVAMNGNDALNTLKTHDFKVFYPENNGREGMMMWLIAFSFLVLGVSVWSIKVAAAVIGVFTVWGLYLLAKELFSELSDNASQTIALLTSFFLAISFWHVDFSRIGFRAVLLPFVLVFSFYFLFRGFRINRIWSFVWAGLFFGAGFYTYTPFRLAVLILPFVFLPCWFFYKNLGLKRQFLLYASCFLLVVFFAALPIGIYFLLHSQDFISRAAPVSVFAAANPVKEFGKSLILHLGMFNIHGDQNWRHNFAGQPELLLPVGILFLTGFFFSIKKLITYFKSRNYSSLSVYCLLFGWFFVMLLPGILTFEGIPHSLRVIGVIPPVFIFSGLAAWKIYEFLRQGNVNQKLLIFTCFLFLAALAVAQYNKYFVAWANNDNVKNAFNQNYADIGYFLNSLAPDVKKYVIVNEPGNPLYGISIPAQSPMFIESAKFGAPRATYLKFEDLNQVQPGPNETVIVPLYDDIVFQKLLQEFPNGTVKVEKYFKFYDLSR